MEHFKIDKLWNPILTADIFCCLLLFVNNVRLSSYTSFVNNCRLLNSTIYGALKSRLMFLEMRFYSGLYLYSILLKENNMQFSEKLLQKTEIYSLTPDEDSQAIAKHLVNVRGNGHFELAEKNFSLSLSRL